jgi:hypothetical protein
MRAMLPLTLFLAKLIGLLFLVFSLLMAINKRAMLAAIDELVRNRGLKSTAISRRLIVNAFGHRTLRES